MIRRLILPALALTLAIAAPARAAGPDLAGVEGGQFAIDKSHAKIIFSVTHFGFSTYYGLFTGFDAGLGYDPKAPEKSSLTVTVDVGSIATTNPKLDEHLKSADFFDAAKFPTATFTATKVALTGPAAGTIEGELTLHGVTRPVTLAASLHGAGVNPMTKKYVLGFDATGVIKRSAFGVSAYVPAVGDEVSLIISGEFDRQP